MCRLEGVLVLSTLGRNARLSGSGAVELGRWRSDGRRRARATVPRLMGRRRPDALENDIPLPLPEFGCAPEQ